VEKWLFLTPLYLEVRKLVKNLKMNERTYKIVEEFIARRDELRINVLKSKGGATVIDCGVEVRGSIEAGVLVTKACLGGLGSVYITNQAYGKLSLPTIHVSTDYPAIATIGSQMADWEVDIDGYFAMGSGPARLLAPDRPLPKAVASKKKIYEEMGYTISDPKEVLERVGYTERSDKAVIVLESQKLPPDAVLLDIAEKCGVEPNNLYAIVTPTNSITCSVQIAGRVVEVGLHKLGLLGFEFKKAIYGSGSSPIAPVNPDPVIAMGWVNDVIRYAGTTFYLVDYHDNEELKELITRTPTAASPRYGLSLTVFFEEAKRSFYAIDLGEFSPAVITASNIRDGFTVSAGKIDVDVLYRILSG